MLSYSSVSPRKQHIMFSTKDPPSIQRIPWPIIEDEENEDYDDEEDEFDRCWPQRAHHGESYFGYAFDAGEHRICEETRCCISAYLH